MAAFRVRRSSCVGSARNTARRVRRSGVGALLCFILGLFAGTDANAYIILASGCAVFLYVSYIMPIGAGILAEGKTWTKKGPFNLGVWSKPVGVLAVLGGGVLAFVGFQPPYQLVG